MHLLGSYQIGIFAESTTGWANVVEYDGIGISITGMSIVFVALVLISLFITALPRVLGVLENYLPEQSHDHHHGSAASATDGEEEIVAALGYVMRQRKRK